MPTDPNSPMNGMLSMFMNQMMGIKNPKRPTAGLSGRSAAPAAPAAPLLGSLSSSYFKRPQAGLPTPGVGGPPQAGLAPMGNRDRGEASWASRYGVKPKWATLPPQG